MSELRTWRRRPIKDRRSYQLVERLTVSFSQFPISAALLGDGPVSNEHSA